MALIECKECKKDVSSEANICPHCGITLKSQKKIISKLIAVMVLVGAVFLVYKNMPTPLEDVAKNYVAQSLFDPESAKFSTIFNGKGKYTICGFVNAKNRMGAYVGATPFVYTEEKGYPESILVSDLPTDADFRIFYNSIGDTDFSEAYMEIVSKCENPKKWESSCGQTLGNRNHKFCDLLHADNFYDKLHEAFGN